MSQRVNKREKAQRILERNGGRMTYDAFKAAMGDDWTPHVLGDLRTCGYVEKGGQRGVQATHVVATKNREAAALQPKEPYRRRNADQPPGPAESLAIARVDKSATQDPRGEVLRIMLAYVADLRAQRDKIDAELRGLEGAIDAMGGAHG